MSDYTNANLHHKKHKLKYELPFRGAENVEGHDFHGLPDVTCLGVSLVLLSHMYCGIVNCFVLHAISSNQIVLYINTTNPNPGTKVEQRVRCIVQNIVLSIVMHWFH